MEYLADGLAEEGKYRLEQRLVENGHADPVYGLHQMPDVVVMVLDDRGNGDLEALIGERDEGGPPLIVVAEHGDSSTMRLAMRAGARDFLSGRIDLGEIVEKSREAGHELTIFVNAKGGSGATFTACSVAHILKSVSDKSTAMLSLDFQFGGLSQYFDTKIKHGLLEVLDSVETLDRVALDAYMTQHESGLRLLVSKPENKVQCHADRAGQLEMLIDKMLRCYEHVIVDMPRRVDPYVLPVLERASRIVLVLQQTLGHLHDATRMLELFRNCGVPPERVLVVANRYHKNNPISLDDIKRTLKGTEVCLIPSDFKTVAESINLGIPIHQHARNSAVTKALMALGRTVSHTEDVVPQSIVSRALSNILGKEKQS